MNDLKSDNLYRQLAKAIFLGAGVIILLWLFFKMVSAVLLLLFALVLAIAINGPVVKLEKRGIKRGWATAIVFLLIFLAFAAIAVFIGPKINEQISVLIRNLPGYLTQATTKISSWFANYPELQKEIKIDPSQMSSLLPSIPKTIMQVGSFSMSLLSQFLVVIVFISMVGYMI